MGKPRKPKASLKTFDPKRFPDIKPTYTVKLDVGNDSYTATSDDLTAAILALQPTKVNYRGLFTLEHNGMTSTMKRTVPRTRLAVRRPLAARYLGRTLLMLLK